MNRMQFGPNKCKIVTLKKGSLVKSKNITQDINTEITELEGYKTHNYAGLNQANGINHKEKIKKRIL